MPNDRRSIAFWIIVVFLVVSIILMLMGQTMAVFNYDLAVRLGLQESLGQVGEFGVQVNRAFGAGDTVVYKGKGVIKGSSLLLTLVSSCQLISVSPGQEQSSKT